MDAFPEPAGVVDVAVARSPGNQCELEQALEPRELPEPPVVPKGELVEVGLKVVPLHAPLVRAAEPSLEIGEFPMDEGQSATRTAGLPVRDRAVLVSELGKVVGYPPIGPHERTHSDAVPHEQSQNGLVGVSDDPQTDTSSVLATGLRLANLDGHP